MATGLSAASVALLLLAVFVVWKWHQASLTAEAERRRADISWAFADDVLRDLKGLRDDASRLDAERKALLKALDQAQRNGIALEADLTVWQRTHQQLQNESTQALTQWTSYSDQLQQSLGSARNQLQDTSIVLEKERQTAAQNIAQLDSEKNAIAEQKAAVEREADALDKKARDLSSENSSLHNDNSSLRSDLSSARSSMSSLETRNSQLCSEINCLNGTISSLHSRISCLEGELSRARSDSSSSNSGGGDSDHHRGRR